MAVACDNNHLSEIRGSVAMLKLSHVGLTKRTNVVAIIVYCTSTRTSASKSTLYAIVTSLHYLCKQGLAIRGHTEATGNFYNLLMQHAGDNAELKAWLARSSYKWISTCNSK
jgi:hypothetical protein